MACLSSAYTAHLFVIPRALRSRAHFRVAAGQTGRSPSRSRPRSAQKLEAQASELFQAGDQAYQQGDLVKAVAKIRESLRIREELYPKDQYPQGHPDLADALNAMGFLLQAQGSYGERGVLRASAGDAPVAVPEGALPAGPPRPGHQPEQPGLPAPGQGSYGEARGYYERALAMHQSLYPKERYPQGHPDLARSLNNLGSLLQAQGSYGEARAVLRASAGDVPVALPQGPLPAGPPRPGHQPEQSGHLLRAQGSYGEARRTTSVRWRCAQLLYPKDRYPQGHPDLASSLNNLGDLLQAQGSYGRGAGLLSSERWRCASRSTPRDSYPQGHPDLATSLNNLGALLQAQGSYGEARGYYERALAMRQSLYPKDRYPQGHPDLATSLNNLGGCSRPRARTARRGGTSSVRWRCTSRCTRRPAIPRATPTWPRA